MNAFGQPLHQAGDANLVHHLGELARPGRAEELAHARIGLDHLLGTGIGLSVASAHDGEHAVLRPGLSARDGGVDEAEAALFRLAIKFAGDLGRGGGVVDEHGALLHAVKGAVRPECHLAQIVVVAHAAHDEVLALGSGLGRCCAAPAVLSNPLLRLSRGAVIHGDVMAAFILEMPGHGIAHDAETEKSHLRHSVLLDHCHATARIPICAIDCDGAALASTVIALTRPARRLWCRRETDASGPAEKVQWQ